MRRRLGAGLLVGAALVCAAPAHAATIEVTASAGPAAEEYLYYRAGLGEKNRVRVHLRRSDVVIVDRGVERINVKRSPFGRCRSTHRRRVVCPDLSVYVILRDGDDTVGFAPGTPGTPPATTNPLQLAENYEDTEGAVVEATYLDGGPGNDKITGSRYNDVILPGSGRDRVQGRADVDDVYLTHDGVQDSINAGGGADGLHYNTFRSSSEAPVTVDLRAGTAGAAGQADRISGFERAHGGPGADVLLGGPNPNALYGEGGSDTIDGREGNDLLTGDTPASSDAFSNRIAGGDGDDLIDARSATSTPTSMLDCGPGADRTSADLDDLLDPSCEQTVFRVPGDRPADEGPSFRPLMMATPVARTADSATFEVLCPSSEFRNDGCTGTLALERPPGAGPPETYGSSPFSLSPGQRTNITVALNPAGQAAAASGVPVGAHITADLAAPGAPGRVLGRVDFGWQRVLAP